MTRLGPWPIDAHAPRGRASRAVAIEQASQDPRTRDLAQIYFARFKIQSTLSAPIRRKGELVGVLCAEAVGKTRQWNEQDVHLCCLLATLATLERVLRRIGHEFDPGAGVVAAAAALEDGAAG